MRMQCHLFLPSNARTSLEMKGAFHDITKTVSRLEDARLRSAHFAISKGYTR
jgi:hypothetical protein